MQDAADLPGILAFVALADSGSFAAASRLLQRDATVLSRRLQSLEARLGVQLAERTTRRVSVTEAGHAYLVRVRPLLLDLEAADRAAAAFDHTEPRGRLRVALPGSYARPRLAPPFIDFLREHPQIQLEAHYANRYLDLVGEGYDAALRLGEVTDSRLTSRKIHDIGRVVCASPGYLEEHPAPQQPEDVKQHACLCVANQDEPLRWDFRRPGGGQVAITANCRLGSNDDELLITAAVAGLGLLYTSDWYVGPELASGQLQPVLTGWMPAGPGAIYVVTPVASIVPAKTRAFSDWIAGILSDPKILATEKSAD